MLRFAVFFGVLILVTGALNLFLFRRTARAFGLGRRGRMAVGCVLMASLAGVIVARVADRLWSEAPVRELLMTASALQFAVLTSALLLLIVDVAALPFGVLTRAGLRAKVTSALAPTPAPSAVASGARAPSSLGGADEEVQGHTSPALARRSFLAQAAAGSALAIGGSSSAYGTLRGRVDYEITEVPVKIPGLSRAYDGFSIVQLSDVHIGQFVGEGELSTAEELIRRAKPDLIVLTGDLLDHDARLAHKLGHFARRLTSLAREGVVAISGNHDYYAGIGPFVRALREGGARVLRNRGEVIGEAGAGFALLGVDDVWARNHGGGPDLGRALRSLETDFGASAAELPRVLLCHNPTYFEEAAGQIALQLSGHTHGGQVNLLLNPAEWVLKNGWVAGAYERDGSYLYVNRGFGTVGPPARIGAPPEVTRIVLTS